MDWHSLIDRIFGFLPERAVFTFALITALFILMFQSVVNKLAKVLEPPWMKKENLKSRKEIIKQISRKTRRGGPSS